MPLTNARGWGDINSRAAMMRRFQEWENKGKQCVLLYCGDHDPSGLAISDYQMTLFESMSSAVGWNPSDLIIERFGLNADFIEANNLTWIEGLETSSGGDLAKSTHKEHKKAYVQDYLRKFGARKVEANTLVVRPEQGRQLCRDAVIKYIDQDGIAEYESALSEAREEVKAALAERMAA